MKDFVTFELAKKLKEKGYPQRPDYFNYSSYYAWDGLRKIHSLSNASVWFDPNISRENIYFAPTISQVLKWLRDKKNLYCLPFFEQGIDLWLYAICKPSCGIEFPEFISESDYDTYEQSAIAGIEYALDNLI